MKKTTYLIGIIALALFFASNVYAYNQNTGFRKGPNAYANNTYYSSNVYALKSAAAPITGSETAVYYTKTGSLNPSICVKGGNRHIYITLMEQDGILNPDDEVKLYEMTFDGYNIDKIKYVGFANTSSNGNLESSGDDTGEFYIKSKMTYVTGDKTSSNGSIYNFDIRVN